MARPPRLQEFDYIGPIPVFLTTCTRGRQQAFVNNRVARFCVDQLLQHAEDFEIELFAYCLMPDHLHLLVAGMNDQSQPLTMFKRWKQKTGFWFRRETSRLLWQQGYWDHVLRDEEDISTVVRYIVANPLRKGLVDDLAEYPWIGASRWTIDDLATVCQDAEAPSWW